MGIIWTIVVGFAAGALAKYIMPGKDGGGFVMTTLLGIGGAFVGTTIGGMLGIYTNSLIGTLIAATAGALLILYLYNKFKKSSG
ncbi:MAG: GlsB/YeaQ/YmgE family stress response membrane protein [Rhodothermia bacterium]|nr:MAG: GlsB/YeaQ/YmgE family stress response membrane protein [Rhodothermia bacterium]